MLGAVSGAHASVEAGRQQREATHLNAQAKMTVASKFGNKVLGAKP